MWCFCSYLFGCIHLSIIYSAVWGTTVILPLLSHGWHVQPDEGTGPKVFKPSLRPLHCGNWVRNADGGSFSSPNYPNTYPPNKECLYVLEGRPQQAPRIANQIHLSFYKRCWKAAALTNLRCVWSDPVLLLTASLCFPQLCPVRG